MPCWARRHAQRRISLPVLVFHRVKVEPLPLETLEREETFGRLRVVMEELSRSDRELLTLRYALDYDTNQIADVLAINPTEVHMRLSRARQRLAERLKAQGVEHMP